MFFSSVCLDSKEPESVQIILLLRKDFNKLLRDCFLHVKNLNVEGELRRRYDRQKCNWGSLNNKQIFHLHLVMNIKATNATAYMYVHSPVVKNANCSRKL